MVAVSMSSGGAGEVAAAAAVITYIAFLLDLFLNVDLLDKEAALDVEDAVQVDARLELADHKVVLRVRLDALDREAADPGRHLAGQLVGLGVLGLQVKGLLAVEGQDLGGRHRVVLVEDGQAGVLVGDVGRLLPGELDRVAEDVVDGEVADAEDGREDGAGEGTAAGDGLVLVEGEGQLLAEEVGDALLEGGHARRAADELDGVDVVLGQLGLGERLLERGDDAVEHGADEVLELLALEHARGIHVVHDRLDVDGRLGVGREHLLELLDRDGDAEFGLGVGVDVDLVLVLEDGGKVVDESLVDVAAAKVAVEGGGEHRELTLAERHDRDGVVAVADVDEADAARLLVAGGQVQLGDAPAEGGGSSVIHEAQELEAGNLGSVHDAAALRVGEPGGHAEHDIRDGQLELGRGRGLDLGQVHGHQLGGREDFVLAQVLDADAHVAVFGFHQVRGNELLLGLDLGVVELAAGQPLEVGDGVSEVGDLLGFCGLAHIAALWAEGHQGTVGPEGSATGLGL